MAWLSRDQIAAMGFGSVAPDALLSEKASYYNCARIHIGARSRIDDFCVLAAGEAGITLGANVHLAVACSLIGRAAITLEDFAGLSSRVAIYSSSDYYTGAAMTNPTVPLEFRQVLDAAVHLQRHVIVGSGSVILPGVILEDAVSVGALSVIRQSCRAFGIYHGNPARRIGERSHRLLELESLYNARLAQS